MLATLAARFSVTVNAPCSVAGCSRTWALKEYHHVHYICPFHSHLAACGDRTTWALVELSDDMPFVQLEVTRHGQPRLLLHNDGVYVDNKAGTYYQYAECNAHCQIAASWTVIDLGVTKNGGGPDTQDYAAHFFKLDPQDRPRFVYTYGQEWIGGESVYTSAALS